MSVEQPASRPPRTSAAASGRAPQIPWFAHVLFGKPVSTFPGRALASLNRDIGVPHRQIEHMAAHRIRSVQPLAQLGTGDLGLAAQEEVLVVAGKVLSSGVLRTSPGRAGRTRRGVTMMTRSVSFF